MCALSQSCDSCKVALWQLSKQWVARTGNVLPGDLQKFASNALVG